MDSVKVVSKEFVENICRRHEGDFFDRKAKELDGRGIQRLVVAFANSDGGEVAVGLSEIKHSNEVSSVWEGASSPEAYNGLLQAVFDINPTVPFRYEFLSSPDADGILLRVFVEKSVEVCKTADSTVYVRIGAQCIPIKDPKKITDLAFAKGARSYEDTLLPDAPPELIVDSNAMSQFQNESRDAIEPLGFCVNEGLISSKDFVPISAGVLLFSDNPSALFPKRCGIKIAFYDTRLEKPEREHLKETITVSGPLYNQIHKAAHEITRILSDIAISTESGFKKVEYPNEAIWEILVNAVIHRDYSIADDIQVLIFQNRVDVISPGRLPGFVTVQNILDTRYSRNPKIVRVLNRYREAPNKDLGEGLNTAFDKMQEWRLKSPEFSELGNSFRVTLPHAPLARPEELVMQFLTANPEIRNRDARSITGIRSENQMKEVFYRLRDQGFIARVEGKFGNKAAWKRTGKTWTSE